MRFCFIGYADAFIENEEAARTAIHDALMSLSGIMIKVDYVEVDNQEDSQEDREDCSLEWVPVDEDGTVEGLVQHPVLVNRGSI